MGTPTFIWYPDGGTLAASREDTDLGEELSDLQVVPARERVTSAAMGGRHSSTVLSAAMEQVRIVNENMSNVNALVRTLYAMQAHLERGEVVGFTRNTAKAWAGYASASLSRGDTAIPTTGDVWYYAGIAALSAGDIVCIEGLGSEGHREYAAVDSVSGTTVTLTTGLLYTYTDDIVMIRWRDYYPVLAWPQNQRQTILTHDRRLNWTLDVTLETDPDVLQALYTVSESGGSTVLIGPAAEGGKLTLADLFGISITDYRGALRDEGGYVVV